jgi:hypothetical protein
VAATVTETRRLPANRSIRVQGTIVLSGSYPAGGEPITFAKPGTTKSLQTVKLFSRNGGLYAWDYVNNKLLVLTAAGVVHATAAYAAAYTADVIDYEVEWPRLG